MDNVFKEFALNPKIIASIVLVVVAIILYFIGNTVFKRLLKANIVKDSASAQWVIKSITRVVKVVFVIAIVFLIFQINGINVASFVTSFGLVGAALTLAAQDIMKDMLNGIYISGEKMFAPGDVIRYRDIDGTVVDFNLRSTKIRLVTDDSLMYISNRNISEVTVLSGINYLDLPLPYEVDVENSDKVMAETIKRATELEDVERAEYLGIQAFEGSYIKHRVLFSSEITKRGVAARAIRRVYLEVLESFGYSVPYEKLELIK